MNTRQEIETLIQYIFIGLVSYMKSIHLMNYMFIHCLYQKEKEWVF